jgi:hypothetical protein
MYTYHGLNNNINNKLILNRSNLPLQITKEFFGFLEGRRGFDFHGPFDDVWR